jgi:hypothetical protein
VRSEDSLWLLLPLWMLISLGLVGCATKVAVPSGFLGNPEQLQRHKKVTEPDYEYRSEGDLPVADGTKIYIEPVVVNLRADPTGKFDVGVATQRRLAESFTKALRTEAAKRHQIVSRPGAATLKVRTVVTELEPSVPAINMVTALYPSTRVSSELKQAVSGEQMFTGEAATEIEVVRLSDGRRIYAMMDHATGRKAISSSGSKWGPVEKLCERWAEDLSATMRGVEPDADAEGAGDRNGRAARRRR